MRDERPATAVAGAGGRHPTVKRLRILACCLLVVAIAADLGGKTYSSRAVLRTAVGDRAKKSVAKSTTPVVQ